MSAGAGGAAPRNRTGGGPQEGLDGPVGGEPGTGRLLLDRFETGGLLLLEAADLGLHHAHAHLPVPAALALHALEHGAGIVEVDRVLLEAPPPVAVVAGLARHLVDLPVPEIQLERGAAVDVLHPSPPGEDRGRDRSLGVVVDGDILHIAGAVVQPADQEAVVLKGVDEDPGFDPGRRALAVDGEAQVGEAMVGLGEHEVVVQGEECGQGQAGQQRTAQNSPDIDPQGPHRRDLVVLGEAAEGHEGRHQDAAGK